MLNWFLALLIICIPLVAVAQAEKKSNPDRLKEEVAQHRRLAEIHENAARCLESGKPEKECHDQLQKECRGVGIGKHCGLRHSH